VIGVRQHQFRAHVLQLARRHRLDRGVRAHGSVDRRGERSVRGVKDARSAPIRGR
jgi:hypothetical protein